MFSDRRFSQAKGNNTVSLRDIQRPLKAQYKREGDLARLTLTARSSQLSPDAMSCSVDIGRAIYEAQSHSGVGGSGTAPCSGDLLLGALAACTQLTAQMVAEAMGLRVDHIEVTVEGDLDLRGTLGIDPSVPVGFQDIRSSIQIRAEATEKQMASLREAVERYCVVLSTLNSPPRVTVTWDVESPVQ